MKFSDGATVVNPGNFPINLQTDAADAHTEIDGVYSSVGGGTNWDAALKAMAGSGADSRRHGDGRQPDDVGREPERRRR